MAARAVRDARRADQFGVSCGSIRVDWPEVLAWKWHVQESFAGDQDALLAERGIRIVHGEARFVSASRACRWATRCSTADHIVIATGSVAGDPGQSRVPTLADTSDDALRYPAPPRSLVIVGGGFIAMELAGIFASFGTRIDIIVRGPRVLPMLDPALAHVAASRLAGMGVQIPHRCDPLADHPERDEGLQRRQRRGRRPPAACDRLRAGDLRGRSASRRSTPSTWPSPASKSMSAGVWCSTTRCARPTRACGRAATLAGGLMQTPVASLQGRTVAQSIASGAPCVPDLSAVPIACFTTPQLATVGLTAEAAEKAGIAVAVHRIDSDSVGAAIADDERDAFVQLVIDESSGVVLGAQIAGPTASDIIYAAAVAIRAAAHRRRAAGGARRAPLVRRGRELRCMVGAPRDALRGTHSDNSPECGESVGAPTPLPRSNSAAASRIASAISASERWVGPPRTRLREPGRHRRSSAPEGRSATHCRARSQAADNQRVLPGTAQLPATLGTHRDPPETGKLNAHLPTREAISALSGVTPVAAKTRQS